jgi:hypothetical protein
MKKVLRYLCFVLLLLGGGSRGIWAQSTPVHSINAAFRTGDVPGIVRYMDNVMEITINNSQSTCSRAQAEMVLRDFFSRNEPRGFDADHHGDNGQSNTLFSIGYLNTSNGRYRVYILQEIRVEK